MALSMLIKALILAASMVGVSVSQTTEDIITTAASVTEGFFGTTDSIDSIDTALDITSELSLVCTCDLTPSICDINCCCDEDCSAKERRTFTACDEFYSELDTADYCFPSSTFFLHNSPFYSGDIGTEICFNLTDPSTYNYLVVPSLIDSEEKLSDYHLRYVSTFYYKFHSIHSFHYQYAIC